MNLQGGVDSRPCTKLEEQVWAAAFGAAIVVQGVYEGYAAGRADDAVRALRQYWSAREQES